LALHKFLIISSEFPPGPGGIGQHAFSLAQALTAHGQVHVLANQDYCTDAECEAFAQSLPEGITLARFASRTHKLAPILRILQAFRQVGEVAPIKIFVTGRFPLWIGALLRVRYTKLPVFGFAHGTEVTAAGGVKAKLTHYACNRLAGMYPVSTFTATQMVGVRYTQIVPNGLDTDFIVASAQKPAAFDWQGNPKLLTVGNLTPRKGQHRVIKALPALRQKFMGVHYHMVGLPSTQAQLQQLATQRDVLEQVTFHGRLPGKADLMRAYATADVFVMLSENQPNGDVEGFGIAILEANALGIPAIGAKGCGIEDAISEHSGILVDGDNPQEIVLALQTLMADYDRYSKGARAWAEKHNWAELVKPLVLPPN
jgi:phosphatidylinositol alpha-1,6-mannosyltransferase